MTGRKILWIGLLLLALLCSCAKGAVLPDKPEPVPASELPKTTENSGETSQPSDVLPTAGTSEETLQGAQPVSEVSIATPEQWNEFARSYNNGSTVYAEYVTVVLVHALDFKDMTFIPLYNAFNGIIKSQYSDPAQDGFYTQDEIQYRKIRPGIPAGGIGFYNITSIEKVSGPEVRAYWYDSPGEKAEETEGSHGFNEARSLFGIRSKSLTVEAVAFDNVDSDLLDCLFTQSADILTVKNVRITNTHFSQGHALLAVNAMTASVTGLTVENSKLDGYEFMSGLIFWVYEDAVFEDIHLIHCDFYLAPDDGGSGIWMANFGLMTNTVVRGDARFANIEIYNCKAVALSVSILCCTADDIEACDDISAQRCVLVSYTGIDPYDDGFGLLIFSTQEAPGYETNIAIRDCLLNGQTDFDGYRQRGYVIENCVAVAQEDPY
jgi:hypothetical protein